MTGDIDSIELITSGEVIKVNPGEVPEALLPFSVIPEHPVRVWA
jgi:hypothetical protein